MHGVVESATQAATSPPVNDEDKHDYKFNYHKAKIRFGLLLADINDALKEGDGKRLLTLYKNALLLYKCHGHTKYAYSTLLFLTKVKAILSADKAESLVANRFCNTHGKQGKIISMDLFLEHRNNSVKGYCDLLGPNFGEESAQRIARSSGITDEILRSVNSDCKILENDKTRSSTDPSEAVKQIVADLLSINAFVFKPGREGYTSFPKISANLVQGLDYRDLYNWMKTRLNEWVKLITSRKLIEAKYC